MERMRNICEWGSSLFLSGVFLIGGIPKLLDVDGFAGVVEAYGLLPEPLVWPAAVFLPVAEVITGTGLLFRQRWAYWSSLAMFIIFIGVLSYGIWLGLDIDCGCFAVGDPEHEAFSGLREALVRDLFFLIPLVYLFFINRSHLKFIPPWRKK